MLCIVALIISSSCVHAFLFSTNHRFNPPHFSGSTNNAGEVSTRLSLQNGNKDNRGLDKGFNLLELAGGVIPQGLIVGTAKGGWKFAWQRMMAELAPQDKTTGSYQRPSYNFASRDDQIIDEADRYHLYVGNPCPWCHRAVLAVQILGIDSGIGVTRLQDDPIKASRGGWVFSSQQPDPLGNYDLRGLYDQLKPGYQGRCTAPLLIDKKRRQIVSNESSDIIRMLNRGAFGSPKKENRIDLYPEALAKEIDATNQWVYQLLNNGVYRCGFSTTQSAYDQASADVRKGLEQANTVLSKHDYLCGSVFTEADLRLLPTMLRFDGAYSPLFKAGGVHLRIRSDYPAIHAWMKRCWIMPGVKTSIDFEDACGSYYKQLFPLNPGGILPTAVTAADLGLE